ncbi:uncharacterized protein KGF55_001276 [Candida pseudojiufengensis]|uniref:uncharacterized protein n=1 Tax=Candida pseudojiufengensis TaxID=497109 RepID=UPI002225715A|nr:uncharacterized protein KGF55_001276 [Candida pseudojiufengensis]KAI5965912.1 hypothetical protein KGF55_001276 [Candida pseudojiufengensis]
MSKKQVLFVGELNKSLPQYKEFQEKYECIDYTIISRDQLLLDLYTKYKDIYAIYGAWLGFMQIGGFREILKYYKPKNLKIISYCSVGYDHIDAKALSKKDIVMTNVPSDGAALPVADLVLFLTITSFRQFQMYSNQYTKVPYTIQLRYRLANEPFDKEQGEVKLKPNGVIGYDFGEYLNKRPNLNPSGHRVVIIGFGQIGKLIGLKLSQLGMQVTYIKRNKLKSEEESKLDYKATYASSLNEAIDQGKVDLIVIACPLTHETHHLLNSEIIDKIPNPFRIINIGRGPIIDESALLVGLKSGKILFAGLDVFETEPAINPELIGRDDVYLTPHIGASTVENFDYTAIEAMRNIDLVLQGNEAVNKVN